MGILSETTSIYKALEFSAYLSLPSNVTEVRMNLVLEPLNLFEPASISHVVIGVCGAEMVVNPSILFLDDPSSGLDARSARFVKHGVQSIPRSDHTVICTIHKPSISIFELFDSLLFFLLGGYTAYFDDLGKDSVTMLETSFAALNTHLQQLGVHRRRSHWFQSNLYLKICDLSNGTFLGQF